MTVGHPFTPSTNHPFTPSSFDLLTVVMHELGRVAGLDDLRDSAAEDDRMFGWLEAGQWKASLAASLADETFALF